MLTGVCSMVDGAITARLIFTCVSYRCLFFGCRGDHSSVDFYLCMFTGVCSLVVGAITALLIFTCACLFTDVCSVVV